MGHLLAVKERQQTTDTMFEPLQQTIALLKVYEQELPDVVYKQLEVWSRHSVTSPSFYCQAFFLFPPPAVAGTLLFLCVVQLPISSLFSGSWQFIICHSCRRCFSSPSPYLLHLSVCLSVCLAARPTAGVAGEVEQRAQAGHAGQTAGGAAAGHRGGRPASEVCLVRRGAAHLQGEFPDHRALQVAVEDVQHA